MGEVGWRLSSWWVARLNYFLSQQTTKEDCILFNHIWSPNAIVLRLNIRLHSFVCELHPPP